MPHVEFRVIWEDVCEKTPPCVGLLSETIEVLANRQRWPDHLCYAAFQRQSTEAWAAKCVGAVTQATMSNWMGLHPLPVGRESILAKSDDLGCSGLDGPGGVDELLRIMPFCGEEEAVWALRIERRHSGRVHTLDLFGLVERREEGPVAGPLAFSVRGRDRFSDLLDHAENWWQQWYGCALPGRPKGSGRWASRENLEDALRQAVAKTRSDGDKVTQENVAKRLYSGFLYDAARQLRADLKAHGIEWPETAGF